MCGWCLRVELHVQCSSTRGCVLKPAEELRSAPHGLKVQCSSTRGCVLKPSTLACQYQPASVQCSSTRGCVLKPHFADTQIQAAKGSMLIDAGLRTETQIGGCISFPHRLFNAHRRGVAY